jgi:ATP-dependent protease ClpP protease subunit
MKSFPSMVAAGLCLLLCAGDVQGQCRGGGGTQGTTASTVSASGSSSAGFNSFGYNAPSANQMQQQALGQIQAYAQQRAAQLAQRAQRNKERHERQLATHAQRRLQELARREERRQYLTASLSSQ